MASDGAFADLRKLAEWFSTSPHRAPLHIERITRRLGATAVPLLGRELRHPDPHRRDAAREALAGLAAIDGHTRTRVIGELRGATLDSGDDNTKVCALGLLAELGAPATATFADPRAMQRRSALALAAQLDTPADVASAADLMVRELDGDELQQMLEVLVEAAPAAAQRLAGELAARLDLAAERRDQIAALVGLAINLRNADALLRAPPEVGLAINLRNADARRAPRPSQVAVLVDAAARLVVVASRKVIGERRWRRWAVLIGRAGRIDDCLHEDDARGDTDGDAGSLIASLCADGYRIASTDLDHARTVVAAAARLTALDGGRLASAYYLGRDLLELGNPHLGARRRDAGPVVLARAIELLAGGEPARAQALLERCEPAHGDAAGALGAALLAQGQHAAALEPLGRAIAAEPDWPLHHWNLAIALHQLGDARGCYHALRRFVATSARPTGLYADPDQPGRAACAERMLAELERTARLTGVSLARKRRKPRT